MSGQGAAQCPGAHPPRFLLAASLHPSPATPTLRCLTPKPPCIAPFLSLPSLPCAQILGVLRSFDQFANLVLDEAVERIIVGEMFADIPLGIYLVRGENLVLMGQMDPAKEEPPGLRRVTESEIRMAVKAEREAQRLKGTMLARMDFLDLE